MKVIDALLVLGSLAAASCGSDARSALPGSGGGGNAGSAGSVATYSATAALHVQVRAGEPNWSGGDKWAADLPATGGTKTTRFIPFDASKWASLFSAPAISFSETLKKVQGLVFVGNSANAVVFYGLRVQGFQPACP